MSGRLWAVVRAADEPGLPGEILTAHADRDAVARLVAELGEGHHLVPVPLLDAVRARVVHTWCCPATVTGGRAEVGEPYRLAGASRLLDAGEPVDETARAVVDEEAARLHAQVSGEVVWHVKGYATTPEAARAAVRARAEELARGFGAP